MRDYETHPPDLLAEIRNRHPDCWVEQLRSGAPGEDVVLVHPLGSLDTVARYQLPHRVDLAAAAMVSFDKAANEVLRELEVGVTSARIAELAGEKRQNYHGAQNGRGGSLDRVQRWIESWNHHVAVPLRLEVGEGNARVVRVERVTFVVSVPPVEDLAGTVARIEVLLAAGVPGLGGVVRVGTERAGQGWRLTYRSTADEPDRVVERIRELLLGPLEVSVERRA